MSAETAYAAHHDLDTLDWWLLEPADLDAMHALHLLSIAGMDAQLVKPESRDFLLSLLQGRGQVIGARDGAQLVAYGVLQHDLLPEDDPRVPLGLAPERSVAKLAGAAVAPDWRGQGLQRILIALRMGHAPASAVLFATAAPDNAASWHSLLACGFAVRALDHRYGGLVRYLLAYDPAAPVATAVVTGTFHAPDALDIDCRDFAQQQSLLHRGWHGVAPGNTPGTLHLVPPPAPCA